MALAVRKNRPESGRSKIKFGNDKRNNKKTEKKRYFHGVKIVSLSILIIAIIGGIGAAIIFASLWLYEKAVTNDFFITSHIDIAGNTRLTRDMVLQYGGIHEGDNSLAVSIADIERNLRDTPWVEDVSVKRLLPNRFIIKIRERLPSFWVRKDGLLYYANERGEIIAPVESKNFLSLPTLNIMPGTENAIPYLAKLLRNIRNGDLPLEGGAIAQVTLDKINGLEIYLEDRDIRLSIATNDWEGNMTRLGMALNDLAKRRELGNAREIRSADGNVWVTFNVRAAG